MFFGIITLLTGLALSAVAAWFAIEGIMAIFAGMAIYGMVMGIVIEAGKVVGVTWIYRHWHLKTKLKLIMIPFVLVAMMLTSMGIFGLLSKAHLEQTAPVSNNTVVIERLDKRIAREKQEIADAEAIIAQLDATVQTLIDYDKISHPKTGAIAVRKQQQAQRDQLKEIIDSSYDDIDKLEDQRLELNQELNALALEVGPVKYIAAIIYEDPQTHFEEAVRFVIIAFIFVFDPMAIMLLMAGNYTLMGRVVAQPDEKPEVVIDEPEPLDDEPDPLVKEVAQLIEQPTEAVSVDQIRKALEGFQTNERELTPAEIAQKGMLEEMLRRKQVTDRIRKGK